MMGQKMEGAPMHDSWGGGGGCPEDRYGGLCLDGWGLTTQCCDGSLDCGK